MNAQTQTPLGTSSGETEIEIEREREFQASAENAQGTTNPILANTYAQHPKPEEEAVRKRQPKRRKHRRSSLTLSGCRVEIAFLSSSDGAMLHGLVVS